MIDQRLALGACNTQTAPAPPQVAPQDPPPPHPLQGASVMPDRMSASCGILMWRS